MESVTYPIPEALYHLLHANWEHEAEIGLPLARDTFEYWFTGAICEDLDKNAELSGYPGYDKKPLRDIQVSLALSAYLTGYAEARGTEPADILVYIAARMVHFNEERGAQEV